MLDKSYHGAPKELLGRRVIIYGNCQAEVLARLMNSLPALNEYFHFVAVLNHAPPDSQSVPILPDSIEQAVLVWEQYDERPEISVREELRKRLRPGCPAIVFPPCTLMSFWPFAWIDPRNVPEPGFPFGRYPWGDRVAHAVAQLALSADESLSRYMDVSNVQMPDVERLVSRDLYLQERRDQGSDVKIGDFIREHIRTDCLFWTWGHPSNVLLGEIARLLCLASSHTIGKVTPQIHSQLGDAVERFSEGGPEVAEYCSELPIHPEVLKRLSIRFRSPDSLYMWMGNPWTFGEYMSNYIMYDRNWEKR